MSCVGKIRTRRSPAVSAQHCGECSRENVDGSERLELTSAVDLASERPIALAHLQLEICTIPQEDYWLDSPRFEVHWPKY